MSAIDIIIKKVSTEGFPVSRERLVDYVLRQINDGEVLVFHYHPVVFTVGVMPEYPVVHIYSDDAGHGIFQASKSFMQDVWKRTNHDYMIAPILSRGVKALARRAGWRSTGDWYPTGHEVYIIERPKS